MIHSPSGVCRISRSGTTSCGGVMSNVAPGFGSSARISAIMSVRSSASTPQSAISRRFSRFASRSRLSSSICIAGSSRFSSASWAARHSFRLDARTSPTGSNRIIRARTASTRSSGRPMALAIAAGSAVRRPAGHSSAIRCAPTCAPPGRRNSAATARRDGRAANAHPPAKSSIPRSSPSKLWLPPPPSMRPPSGPPSLTPPES